MLYSVGIELTNLCNLRCIHCYADSKPTSKEQLPTEKVKSLIKEISEMGALLVNFSGGEPFMRKDLMELIKYSRDMGLDVSVNTNGTLLNRKILSDLSEMNIRGLEFSIDGANPATHDEIRGVNGCFKKVIKNFDLCHEYGITPGMLFTVLRLNYKEIHDVIKLAIEHKSIGIGFLRFKPIGRGKTSMNLELSTEERHDTLNEIYDLKLKYEKDLMVKVECPQSILIPIERSHKLPDFFGAARGCPGGKIMCNIMPNGEVRSCPQLPVSAGNINKQKFRKIWEESALFKDLRSSKLKGKCGKCTYKEICGGCRSAAYLHYSDYLEEDPGCWIS